MELRHLRYFVAVAELGSFSRASRKLFIAQPPLSIQIKQLEEEVGVPLLERHRRGARLTVAGAMFFKEAKAILVHTERAKVAARRGESMASPSLGIGFVPSAGYLVLPQLVKGLRKEVTDLVLQVKEMSTSEQVGALEAGEIQIGLGRAPIPRGSVTAIAQLHDPFCVAIPKGDLLGAGRGPLEMKSLTEKVFVTYARKNSPDLFHQSIALCTDAGFNPDVRYSASSVYGLLDLVSAGLGVALVPATAALLERPQIRIRPVHRPTREVSLSLLKHSHDDGALVDIASELSLGLFKQLSLQVERVLK